MKYIGVSTPSWSIAGRRPTKNTREEQPERPLESLVKHKEDRGVSWSFGNSKLKRYDLVPKSVSNIPGPGHYNLNPQPQPQQPSKRARNLKSTRFSLHKPKVPSRGSFYPVSETPGVGRYDISSNPLNPNKGFTMGYKPGTLGDRLDKDKWTKTKKEKERGHSTENPDLKASPGPGAYEVRDRTIQAEVARKRRVWRGESFRGRSVERESRENRSQRGPDQNISLPDCFDELRKKTSKKGTFGTASLGRKPSHDKSATQEYSVPGPGAYHFENNTIQEGAMRGKGAVLLGKWEDSDPKYGSQNEETTAENGDSYQEDYYVKKENLITPGPGHYDVRGETGKDTLAYSMGGKYNMLSQIVKQGIPGPGEYNIRKDMGRDPRKGARITSAHKRNKSLNDAEGYETTPGPGTYNLRSDSVDGPKYSIQFKRKSNSREISGERGIITQKDGYEGYKIVPPLGPQSYKPLYTQIFPDSHAPIFSPLPVPPPSSLLPSASPRHSPINPSLPSPSPVLPSATGPSFTKAPRPVGIGMSAQKAVFPEPGPGSYNILSTVPQLQKWEKDKLDVGGRKIKQA